MICDDCGVDHRVAHADLSHGNVHLIRHAQEHIDWLEHPISGDHVALQRAGHLPPSLLWSVDWQQLGERYSIRDIGDENEGDWDCEHTRTRCATCDGGGCGDCA